ncbi:MAG: right-handed parallel beta-helix repeat-containing protein [Thermoguttaceae bacterium]|nr:right-handed parallel beta-helix repeat-containing protein [Thermoguttaceae bacterium]
MMRNLMFPLFLVSLFLFMGCGEHKEKQPSVEEIISGVSKKESQVKDSPTNKAHISNQPKVQFATVPNDFSTIEDAYAHVKDNGIITIKPGKYELTGTLVVDRDVTFRGDADKMDLVVIDCPTSDTFKITNKSPSFQNLSLTCRGKMCNVFNITGGTPKLFRCTVISRAGTGIRIQGEDADPQIESSIFKNCEKSGVLVLNKGRGSFTDCQISGNKKAGIYVTTSGNPTVTGCRIRNGKACGVFINDNGLGEFNDCEISENALPGIAVTNSGNQTFTACKIYWGKQSGMFVYKNGLGVFRGCEIYGNDGAGIEVTTDGNPTVTRCKIRNGSRVGVLVSKNGTGKFNDCEIYSNTKSGIDIQTSGNPTITKCKIYDGRDSGVCIREGGLGIINNCAIYGNANSGIEISKMGNPTVTKCKIYDGKQYGVSVKESGLGKFDDSEIYENEELGIGVETLGNPTFSECIIRDDGKFGILVKEKGLGEFNDCKIYGNSAGIIVTTLGNPTVTRCTIHDGRGGVTVTENCLAEIPSFLPKIANLNFGDTVGAVGVGVGDNGLGEFNDCEIYGTFLGFFECMGNPTVTRCKIHDVLMGIGVVGENSLGEFFDCEIYRTAFGIAVKEAGNPTVARCKIHGGFLGIGVIEGGKGTYNNNVLYENSFQGQQSNWYLEDVGDVKGTGNTPEMPLP